MKKTTVMLLSLIAVTAFALPLASAGEKATWTGWITDESCGAGGAKAEHKACAKKCADNGAKLVFYNNADKKIYTLDKQDLAKKHVGDEVKVTGVAEGAAITVDSIAAAK